jgi:asparagine synthase (glutamine-hydrolysing)
MSVQFGKCNFDGKPVNPEDLDPVRAVLTPYGPDGERYICNDNLAIIYRAFHTTKESHRETQPHISKSGAVITWDGRLDNREELIDQLNGRVPREPTDLELVEAALECWGTEALQKWIGDWALSIWDPKDRSLTLARDFVGTRHLFYSVEKDQVTWCTILDPLVLFAGRSFKPDEEFIAGWLSFFPAPHITPYLGIHSVPPSSFVQLRKESRKIFKYWDFDPGRRVCYRTDGEYEEHFRAVFSEAVRRRLRSSSPVLAELSGGMDSSSIVCMADRLMAAGTAETPRVDTVSYYDDGEPNWNERPYFTKVEEWRGRAGRHIDVGSHNSPNLDYDHFAATPGSGCSRNEAASQFAECVTSQANRVVLSGVGGDEVTGGIPAPGPELEDLLARGNFRQLAHQLKLWALNKRKPWFRLFLETVHPFLPAGLIVESKYKPVPWLSATFVKRNTLALQGYPSRVRLLGPLPSFQHNLGTLEALQRQLGCCALSFAPPYEKRYPYLDRSLLEFIYAIPREQLIRPGQRRSLMRRALVGLVPVEILNRRRKAFVVRGPMTTIANDWPTLVELTHQMLSDSLGIISSRAFLGALQKARTGHELATNTLMRTIAIECWLRKLSQKSVRERSGLCSAPSTDPSPTVQIACETTPNFQLLGELNVTQKSNRR